MPRLSDDQLETASATCKTLIDTDDHLRTFFDRVISSVLVIQTYAHAPYHSDMLTILVSGYKGIFGQVVPVSALRFIFR